MEQVTCNKQAAEVWYSAYIFIMVCIGVDGFICIAELVCKAGNAMEGCHG
jgi:hypothetical protein